MEDPLTGPEDVLHGAVPEVRVRTVRRGVLTVVLGRLTAEPTAAPLGKTTEIVSGFSEPPADTTGVFAT